MLTIVFNVSAESLFIPTYDNTVQIDYKGALSRPVIVNHQALQHDSIKVDTFFNERLTIKITNREIRKSSNYSLIGKLPNYGKSEAILTYVDGVLTGNIRLIDNITNEGRIFEISERYGQHQLREVLPEEFPDEDHPNIRTQVQPDFSVPAADAGDIITIMVVYSAQSGSIIGTAAASFAQQAVDSVNRAWSNSGITPRLSLVYTYVSSYSESGDFNTDLNRLTSTSDGFLDEVHTLRNQYGADMVSMIIENGQYCGLGWIGPSASYAFTTVNRGCAVSNLSFAHELGHNFGALHDVYVDPGTYPYAYGHGYAVPTERWRTVMAYNNACTAVGVSCTRLTYFSNPNVLYGSTPMGTPASADNTRVINNNAYVVANFKTGQQPIPPAPSALYLTRT